MVSIGKTIEVRGLTDSLEFTGSVEFSDCGQRLLRRGVRVWGVEIVQVNLNRGRQEWSFISVGKGSLRCRLPNPLSFASFRQGCLV